MKVVMMPVQVCAIWDEDGKLRPLAFCFKREGKKIKVAVESQSCEEERVAGHIMLNFLCRTTDYGKTRMVFLRYDIRGCRWYLYKI